MSDEKVKNDAALRKWVQQHPDAQTTVIRCERCGLYYKPILGHKCKEGIGNIHDNPEFLEGGEGNG